MRGARDEAAHPKYAHLEIERRWLVDPAAVAGLVLEDPIAIADRYIIGTRIRLRRMQCGGEAVYKLTRKYRCEDAASRPIVTAYLDEDEHAVFAALPALPLVKTRFKLEHAVRAFSLDRFGGNLQGLWLSEIEWPSLSELAALADPPWAMRDVTYDPAYQGASLARSGIPE
ncbi:hypothetical protein ACLBKU_08890 [Erythrobacter sp. NE805]|uniref:hypothetical protein n=1 Tax=Erythrobacter sp. NE805 TaxID=3389875 RepID=UPI00396B35E8